MRTQSIAIAVTLSVAAACGASGDDDGTGGGVALADLGTAAGDATCGRMEQCCTPDEIKSELGITQSSDCRSFYVSLIGGLLVPVLQDSIDHGRLTYDPVAMKACLDLMATLPCAELPAAIDGGPTTTAGGCHDPFVGLVALNGECANDVDCQSKMCFGEVVDFMGHITTLGGCVTPPTDGQACIDDECAGGFYCDHTGGADTCKAVQADGTACTSDAQCRSNYCVNHAMCGPKTVCDGL